MGQDELSHLEPKMPVCPWCKKEPFAGKTTKRFETGESYGESYSVECLNLYCPVSPSTGRYTELQAAIEAWRYDKAQKQVSFNARREL
jgi:hypothetical protein